VVNERMPLIFQLDAYSYTEEMSETSVFISTMTRLIARENFGAWVHLTA
jgi:hypothetical protein